MASMIISNEEMKDIMKIVNKESGLLNKSARKTIKCERNEQKCGFLGML